MRLLAAYNIMSEKHLVTRPAAVFSGFTIISRILGLVRDILAASIFGASVFWDAFVVAFTFPNLFRRIFGEGALNAAFVPVFSEYMHEHGKKEAWRVANIIVTLLTVVLIVLCLGVFGVLTFTRFFFPLSERLDLILKLSQIVFPYVIFICLIGLFMGILNTFHHLVVPALSPVIFNIVIITGLLSTRKLAPDTQVILLAFAVLIAGFIELGIHIPVLRNKGMHYRSLFIWKHPAVKKILWLMAPMVLGFGITQVNIVVDRFLALWLGTGKVSTLYFGNRIMQLPLGIFGVAMAVASLSVMSKQAVRKDLTALKDTLNYSLRIVFFISLPACAGLIVLRNPIVRILFERKAFTSLDTSSCSMVVLCYSLGLFAYLGLKIVTQCFYALQDTRTPVKIGVVMVGLNLVLNLILMIPLKEAGLALATSICAVVNMSLLLILLSKKLKGFYFRNLSYSFIRSGLSALIMGIGCWFLAEKVWKIDKNIFLLLGIILIGLVLYFLTSIFLGAKEPKELIVNFRNAKTEK